ncbi:MAG: AAA family ATPase, partial [Alphaproteobacteria bacterium]|nr:AAA family ATPase [Alphaproteobacteria bacterium]
MSYEKVLERSPMRAFDRSIHGAPSEGGVGVVAGRAGVGKSALIVHIALDHLLRGDRVLHISLREEAESVRNFYTEIFDALSRVARLVGRERDRAHLQVEQNRQIQCYLERAFSVDDLEKALSFTAEVMHFTPALVILDGYDPADASELERLSALGQARGFSVWASVRTHREESGQVPHEDGWQTIVALEPVANSVELKAHKVNGEIV